MKEIEDRPDPSMNYRGAYGKPEIKEILDRLGVVPQKSMGQNFLTDSSIAESIVSALDPGTEDVVVEIGAGTGALTRYLAGRVRRLILVEYDQSLAGFLRERFAGNSSVQVEHADAAKFDLRPLFKEGPVKVIGNLPYSCAGEIMRRFLDPPTPVVLAVMMLQNEVADRLLAVPRTKAYGRLTLLTKLGWRVERLSTLTPDPFYPKPGVDSAVLRLRCRSNDEIAPYSRVIFDRLLRCGFAQRRKQLKKRLPLADYSWSDVSEQLGISQTARAEELVLEDWLAMARMLDGHPLKDAPQSDDEMFDVVDGNNNITGQERRKEVHACGLLHRAVHVFVFNALGELYLQKRSNLKDTSPGLWDSSASGHLDVGEDYRLAAEREVLEELGVQISVEEICELEACRETGWEFVRLYCAEHGGPFLSPCSEVEMGMFMPQEVVDQWVDDRPRDFASGFVECWKNYVREMRSRDNEN